MFVFQTIFWLSYECWDLNLDSERLAQTKYCLSIEWFSLHLDSERLAQTKCWVCFETLKLQKHFHKIFSKRNTY